MLSDDPYNLHEMDSASLGLQLNSDEIARLKASLHDDAVGAFTTEEGADTIHNA
jgi:hypothetical protein